jgi:hypothetical protein
MARWVSQVLYPSYWLLRQRGQQFGRDGHGAKAAEEGPALSWHGSWLRYALKAEYFQ